MKPVSFCFLPVFFFLLFSQQSISQNLIPDSGFEIWNNTVGSPPETMSPLTHWYNANGTPDHHHQQNPPGSNLTSLQPCPTGNGNTDCGFPYEGEGVLGCYKGNGSDGTKEWAGVQLTEPMVAGGCYEISFWLQNKKDNPNFFMATSHWGIFFSHTQFPTFSPNVGDFNSMADHWITVETMADHNDWQQYHFEYVASEAFEYAYVGFVGDALDSEFQAWSSSFSIGFYAWFDEIRVDRIHPNLTLSDDVEICPGDSILLTASSNFPILWEDGLGDEASIWVKPQETTTYFVETQDSTDCAIRDSVTVNIIPAMEMDYASLVCEETAPFFLAPNAGNGTWSGNGIVDAALGLFDPSQAGVGDFAIQFIDDSDCSENLIINVPVLETPPIDFEADIQVGCLPLEVQFTDLSPTPGISYEWNFGDGATSSDLVSASHIFTDPGEFDISLSIIYAGGCNNSITIPAMVQVNVLPIADFSQTVIATIPKSVIQFESLATGDITEWLWDFGDNHTDHSINPLHHYELPGEYEVQLSVISSEGCIDSIQQTISISNEINFYIPNVFSPNGDGLNDEFQIFPFGKLATFQITIFDRWGGMVFQSNNPNEYWDGTIRGRKAPEGIYVYAIEYVFEESGGTKSEHIRGDVLILR